MAVKTKDITYEDSMMEQMGEYVLEAGTHYATSSKEAVQRFVKYLDNKRVVDLGCGDGAATPFFKEADVKVIGVDINQGKLKLNPTPTIKDDMIGYLKAQPDNSIPNIFCHHALEHLPIPDVVLKLISEKLAAGGYVYIEVPAGDIIHSVHHSTFDSPEDITPPDLEVVEQDSPQDEHYVIARKPDA